PGQTTQLGASMDQNANGVTAQTVAVNGQGPGDVYAVPTPAGAFTYRGGPFPTPHSPDAPPLIVPRPHHPSTSPVNPITGAQTSTGADNQVSDGTISALAIVFDRDMRNASFTPAQVLRIIGPQGQINPTAAQPITVTPKNDGTAAGTSKTFYIGF